MHDQNQADPFACKHILIGDASGESRDSSRTKDIKEKDSRQNFGLGHIG